VNPVYTYTDYRKVILDFYQGRKVLPAGFSWREFAKVCGYASPVYLKLVAEGKSALSEIGVERVANALGLTGRESQYFRALVRFNQGKSSAQKKLALAEMRTLSDKAEVKILDHDQYDYYGTWYNSALRELAPLLQGASAEELGQALIPSQSAHKVRKSLDLLSRNGLLAGTEGGYTQTNKSISTGSEVTSLAVRDMHRQMGELGVAALENIPREDRDISGLTLGLSSEAYGRIVRELAEFRRRVVSIASEDSGVERVYRLNLQMFPLSQNGSKTAGVA
jgi:uncharacterized protein (TIGR02147 family)